MSTNSESRPAAPGLAALAGLSEALADVVERVGASTVALRAGHGHRGATDLSGVVWREGVVVTTAHAWRRPPATATLVAAGGVERQAACVGLDSRTDLTVFRLDEPQALPVADIDDAAGLRPGELAVAVGRSPRGDLGASFGMVHRVGGAWQTWLGGTVDRRIELDGGLHGGQSGAPVAGATGRVFGIASPALSRSRAIVLPAATVSAVVEALLSGGRVARPYLGVGAQPVVVGEGAGLLVTALAEDGPAARAGLLVGDIVLSVDGQPAPSLQDLRAALSQRIGQSVPVALSRGGAPARAAITVGEWPARSHSC